jgi:predicted ribosomally synthesized peptide with SipW-like signal peptide
MTRKQSYDLSRRSVLLGLGTVGLASAGAGLGTTAYFSDRESFVGNSLQAGSLDLFVRYDATYDSDGAVENMADEASGTVDGDPAGTFYVLDDVKPGDSGRVTFCFEVEDNPSYMWACGDLTQAENGMTEPEAEVDATDDVGELAESIDATLSYCSADGSVLAEIADGTLLDLFGALNAGVPLDGDARAGVFTPGEQTMYDDVVTPEQGDAYVTGPCLCLDWEIPVSVGNEIQSDSLEMALTFHALQARHNDGTYNPCVPSVQTRLGTGFGKLAPETNQNAGYGQDGENFNTDGTENSFARARYGDSLSSGAWELAVGKTTGDSTKGQLDWTSYLGSAVPFRVAYDGDDDLSFELGPEATPVESISYSGVPGPNGKIVVTSKTDEATATVSDLALSLDGTDVNVSGPTSFTSTNDDATADSDGGRDIRYLVFDTTAADLAAGFVLSGEMTVDVQGDFPGGDEDLSISISLE